MTSFAARCKSLFKMSGKSETSPPSGVTDENQPTGQESTASSPTSSVSPEAPNPERTPSRRLKPGQIVI
ncbi:hypothetical protein TMatcc_006447 [Talaromyces marneffei ATCC 18224]